MFYYIDDGVFESLVIEQPRSVEENIQKGTNAFLRVMNSHSAELMAMFRKELGWIGFEWGTPGEEPPEFESHEAFRQWQKTGRKPYDKGGHGISHFIAKRDWEGEYIQEFQGQKGIDLIPQLIGAIARGETSVGATKATITFGCLKVIFVKKRMGGSQFWLLTGFIKSGAGYTYVPKSKNSKGVFEDAGEYSSFYDQTLYLRMNGLHLSVHPWEQRTQPREKLNNLSRHVNPWWPYGI